MCAGGSEAICPFSSSEAASPSEADSAGEKAVGSCASSEKSSIEAGSEGEVMASVGERRFGSGLAVVGVALAVLELLSRAVLMEWRVGRFGVDFEYSVEGVGGGF